MKVKVSNIFDSKDLSIVVSENGRSMIMDYIRSERILVYSDWRNDIDVTFRNVKTKTQAIAIAKLYFQSFIMIKK